MTSSQIDYYYIDTSPSPHMCILHKTHSMHEFDINNVLNRQTHTRTHSIERERKKPAVLQNQQCMCERINGNTTVTAMQCRNTRKKQTATTIKIEYLNNFSFAVCVFFVNHLK